MFRSFSRVLLICPWSTHRPREGDWLCICRRLNFMRHSSCCECERARPKSPHVYGRWTCGVCAATSSTTKDMCWNCFNNRSQNWKELSVERRETWQCDFFECRAKNTAGSTLCVRCKRPQQRANIPNTYMK